MLVIRRRAYARAGLVGNPSDGYGGKTLSVIVRNFSAEIILYEWEDVELVWTDQDQSRFRSVHELVRDVKLHGYYGGMRLEKATVKKFVEYCVRQGHAARAELLHPLPERHPAAGWSGRLQRDHRGDAPLPVR